MYECKPFQHSPYQFDYLFEAGEEWEPIVSIPKIKDYWKENVRLKEATPKTKMEFADMSQEEFEQLEYEWLYPKELGLS